MILLNNFFSKTAMSILLIVVCMNDGFGQDNELDFFDNYIRTGAFVQYTHNFNYDLYLEDPSVNIELLPYKTATYGFLINIYQTHHFNFKTGLIFKPLMVRNKILFTSSQTGLEFDLLLLYGADAGKKLFGVPVLAEYLTPLSNKIIWSISSGVTVNWLGNYKMGVTNIRNDAKIDLEINYKNKITLDGQLATGFYFLFKPFMFHLEFRYSKSFTPIVKGKIFIENFQTIPHNSLGRFNQSGDYYGVSLSIFLKKGKKKKARQQARRKKI